MNVVFKNQNTETISLFKSDFSRPINGLQKIRLKKWGMSCSELDHFPLDVHQLF